MLTLITKLQTAIRNRARYHQTRDEIARLPRDIAIDTGLFAADADQIAYDAVYGKAA